MDYLEFIARVTPHIPDKGQVTDLGRIFFMIFSFPGRRGLVDFLLVWRLERSQGEIPALSSRP
jgi:hypothetical protein